jgi:hypothetical protein
MTARSGGAPTEKQPAADALLGQTEIDRLLVDAGNVEFGHFVGGEAENLSVPLAQSTVNSVGVNASS